MFENQFLESEGFDCLAALLANRRCPSHCLFRWLIFQHI